MAAFHPPLDALVETYRRRPFQFWAAQFEEQHEIHDCAEGDSSSSNWWQADTTVLEIEIDSAGQRYAHVAIWLCPFGVTSSPPAPSAGFLVYENGKVKGTWANGTKFEFAPHEVGTMPPNTSLGRTREG